jgi:hypothetical protein
MKANRPHVMHLFTDQEAIHKNPMLFYQRISYIREVFSNPSYKLQKVKQFAQKVREGIEQINPFIQQSTEIVCPGCMNICCINKHGYHNSEDLIYIQALGLRLPDYNFDGDDSAPCQFLSDKGCVMHRSVRPSGCNWYFCDPLLEHMEARPEYGKFDDGLRDVAELWLEMMDEFQRVIKTCGI